MASSKKYLDELTPKTRNFTVRVTVSAKNRVQEPIGKSKYQHVFLKDDKNNVMRATLYTAEIENYANSLMVKKRYDISGAAITIVNLDYRERYGTYQMTINNRTMILAVDEESSTLTQPIYRVLSSITPETREEEEFDVAVVVLYIGPVTPVAGGKKVRDFIVTDASIEDTMIVSGWNDFAEKECTQLAEATMDHSPIVSLSNVKRRNFKGVFGLATTLATFLSFDPEGDQIDALKTWKTNNQDLIEGKKAKVKATCDTSAPRDITTIKDAYAQIGITMKQGYIFRLKLYIPDFRKENISIYVGCSSCGRKCQTEMNLPFDCEYCERNSTATARLFFNFTATDGSGTIDLVAYTENAEKLLQLKADRLLQMNNQELKSFYQEAQARFRTLTTYIDVIPVKPPMPHMKICNWAIKGVLLE